MSYQPGKHLIATLSTPNRSLLLDHAAFRGEVDLLISKHTLKKLGEVYHDFSPAGFTGVVCLSESHISVHTWPEHGLINLDIYLSNFERNNDNTVQQIYQRLESFFEASTLQHQIITR